MIDPTRLRKRLRSGLRTPGPIIRTKRHATDFYVTPPSIARQLSTIWIDWMQSRITDTTVTVLDVGAGTGVWGWAISDIVSSGTVSSSITIDGIDLIHVNKPPWYRSWYGADLFDWYPPEPYTAVIGNPPFYAADYLISFALRCCASVAAFLLPLSFLSSSSVRHQALWTTGRAPHAVYVLDRRPKFDARVNNTNKYDVAWYLWDLRCPNTESIVRYIRADVGSYEDIFPFYVDPIQTYQT